MNTLLDALWYSISLQQLSYNDASRLFQLGAQSKGEITIGLPLLGVFVPATQSQCYNIAPSMREQSIQASTNLVFNKYWRAGS